MCHYRCEQNRKLIIFKITNVKGCFIVTYLIDLQRGITIDLVLIVPTKELT